MKAAARPVQIDLWNEQAKQDASTYDLPQYWLLISPLECHALIDGVVSTRIQEACAVMKREVLVDPDDPVWAASGGA